MLILTSYKSHEQQAAGGFFFFSFGLETQLERGKKGIFFISFSKKRKRGRVGRLGFFVWIQGEKEREQERKGED